MRRCPKSKVVPLPVEDIKAAITSAGRARNNAQQARDAGALAAAIRRQLTEKRRAGKILAVDAGLAEKLGKATAEYCIALARLSTAAFRDKVEGIARRAVAALATPHSGGSRMLLSDWKREADGSLSRTLTAVDDEGAKVDGGRQT